MTYETFEKIILPLSQGILLPLLLWILKSLHDLKLMRYEFREEMSSKLDAIDNRVKSVENQTEENKNQLKLLVDDYQYRAAEESWHREMLDTVDKAREYLSECPELQRFAIMKAEKFTEYVLFCMKNYGEQDIETLIDRGWGLRDEFKYECGNRFNREFAEDYYKAHDVECTKYMAEIRKIVADRYNDKRRRIYIESLRFMSTFLRIMHDTYFHHFNEKTKLIERF